MIKINQTGPSPSWYQIDNSYNLPNFTGVVQWNGNTKCFEVSTGAGGGWQRIDNNIQISHSHDMYRIAAWVYKKMEEEEQMQKLRSKYPALDEAYNHLELIKALVISGTETNDIQQN